MQVLRDALSVHPEHSELWGQLAMTLLAAQRPAEAYEAARERIRLSPQSEWGHRLASLALSRLDRPYAALDAARYGVELDPHEWRTHVRYARVLADLRMYEQALPAAMKAVELAPEQSEPHMTVGSIAVDRRDWHQAESAFRHVLSLEPDNAAARNNLALVTLRRGGVVDAAEGFADAVATDPRVEVARRNLEVTFRVAAAKLLRALWVVGLSAYFGLRVGWFVPVVVAVAAVALGTLAVVAYRQWRGLPVAVRDFARRLPRTGRRWAVVLSVAGLAVVGFVAGLATAPFEVGWGLGMVAGGLLMVLLASVLLRRK